MKVSTVVSLFSVVSLLASSVKIATALENPTISTGAAGESAGFLPAPNPTGYCASPTYFDYWNLVNPNADGTVAGTAQTEPGGITMTVTDVAGVGDGLRTNAPAFGIIHDENDDSVVTISEPLFYSQWVFVDVDLNAEGFSVTGSYSGAPPQGVAVMGRNSNFNSGSGGIISANQATGQAQYQVGDGGANQSPHQLATRFQVDFLGVIDRVNIDKLGAGGAGFAVSAGCQAIGIAKEASNATYNSATGTYTFTYTLRVINNLPTQAELNSLLAAADAANTEYVGPTTAPEIPIANLQVADDLRTIFGVGNFTVSNVNTGTLAPNPAGFNGDSEQNLLAPGQTLGPKESHTITFDVTYTPPSGTSFPLTLSNQAVASGVAAGATVSDRSDNGANPGPGHENGSGGSNDPTPITLNAPVDYGDAPDSYATDGTDSSGEGVGPSHVIVSGIYLGTPPDAETDAVTPLDGTGDNADGTDDEDGITLPTLTAGATSYTIQSGNIVATGTGTLHSWVDFDKSGTFDPGEYASIAVTNGTLAGDLNWNSITVGAVGDTYARFRFTSDVSINANTPGGAASDGEVEDYQVTIQPDLSNKACPAAKADLWFANDESGSVNASEFNDSLDFLYQVSDKFIYDETTGMKAGITGWGSNVASAEVIIPITDQFGDLDDSGLIGDGNISIDNDGRGLRELYDAKKNTSTGTRLDYATNYLTNLINAGNGRRAGVPQVAIILTDASSGQLSNSGSGGGTNWITAANNLRNAGPDGTNIVVIIINEAATAYNNDDPGVRSTVDAVVGSGKLFIATTYAEAADATNGYVDAVAQTICDATQPVASNPNVLLVKRITSINGQTSTESGDDLSVYKDEATNPYDDNTVTIVTPPASPTDPKQDTDKWPPLNTFLLGGTNGGISRPDDEIEYTIYFLSAGDNTADNVLFCDRVPENVSYLPTAYSAGATAGIQLGIQLNIGGSITSLTGTQDNDAGFFFPAGVNPQSVFPNVNCGGQNTNGAVVVNLGNLPNATAPATPTGSFGFVRFKGKVK